MWSYESSNVKKSQTTCLNSSLKNIFLVFYEKLVSRDIQIEVLIGQSYNRHNWE